MVRALIFRRPTASQRAELRLELNLPIPRPNQDKKPGKRTPVHGALQFPALYPHPSNEYKF